MPQGANIRGNREYLYGPFPVGLREAQRQQAGHGHAEDHGLGEPIVVEQRLDVGDDEHRHRERAEEHQRRGGRQPALADHRERLGQQAVPVTNFLDFL